MVWLSAVLAGGACDGKLSIKGAVVTAPEPLESRIYVDRAPAINGMRPVDSAIVTVVESPDRGDSLWRGTDTTTATGAFSYFSVTCPCKFPVEISVTRPGYAPVVDTFVHRGKDHSVVVVLARQRQ
jgi:hypothetical protein